MLIVFSFLLLFFPSTPTLSFGRACSEVPFLEWLWSLFWFICRNYSLEAGSSLKPNDICYVILVIYMYWLNTMMFLFLLPLKGMIIMELSSKILTVLCIIKEEGEEIVCVEEPSLENMSSWSVSEEWCFVCRERIWCALFARESW